jgi:phosphatidate cytidylyltransferase
MALNLQTFKTRTLTAIVFVAVMLLGMLWNEWSFFFLFSVIHFGCWHEYQSLIAKTDPGYNEITPFHRYGVMIAGWSLMLFACGDMLTMGNFNFSSIGFWLGIILLFVLPVVEILFARKIDVSNIRYSLLGLIYISLSWAMLVHLRSGAPWMPEGETRPAFFGGLGSSLAELTGYMVPLLIIASIWINDTMAYLVGSLIGKTPFSATSPKKTMEGTIGGIILSVLAVTLFGVFVLHGVAGYFLGISAISAIAGTAGDLLESKLKRMAGVKDSGSIMPGHGGFLDRFDSLLLAIPFVWLFCILFMR